MAFPGYMSQRAGKPWTTVDRVTQAGCGIRLPAESATERTMSDKLYQLLHDASLQLPPVVSHRNRRRATQWEVSISLIEALAFGRTTPEAQRL